MFRTGTGCLSDVFKRKQKKLEIEEECNWAIKHSEYIKYPIGNKIKVDKSSSVEGLCDVCENGSGDLMSCVECQQALCSRCALRHKNMRSSMFHHLTGNNVESEERVDICPKHSKQTKTLYCLDCSKAMCIYCKLLYHAEHSTNDIFQVANAEILLANRSKVDKRSNTQQLDLIETASNEPVLEREQRLTTASSEDMLTKDKELQSVNVLVSSVVTGVNLNDLRRDVCDAESEPNIDTVSNDSIPVSCEKTCYACRLHLF